METFVGDSVTITLSTGIDLTGHTEILIKYEKPDGSTGNWVPVVPVGDGTSIEYTTVTTTLNQAGTWRLQAFVAFGLERLHGRWAELKVFAPLC